MNIRLLVAALFLALATATLSAQTLRPLTGYEALLPPPAKEAEAEKMETCEEFSTIGFTLVAPGNTRTLRVTPDTTGLGGDLTEYRCEGCATADFGNVTYDNDTLIYRADAGAELGIDTLRLSRCNRAGDCSVATEVVVLVRRANRTVDLPAITLNARDEREVIVPTGDLPGGTTCRTLASCTDTYGGRSQRFDFTDDDLALNNFNYLASGYGGADQVCVTICNDFGICDTYRQRINVTVGSVKPPFFDDFAYDGVRPERTLWQDEDVLINKNFAQSPPTIGVATFDGVAFDGQSYPRGSGGRVTVVRDYLTSVPLLVEPADDDLVLGFYLQPRGFGNRPETQDSFIVQFLTQEGSWRNVYARAGLRTTIPGTEPFPFELVRIPVASEYLYRGFQFRFASRSSEQGAVDMWHLDYVTLDEVSSPQDVAFAERPDFLLAPPFTAIPYRHLSVAGQSLLANTLSATVQNFDTEDQPLVEEASFIAATSLERNRQVLPSLSFVAESAFSDIANSANSIPAETRGSKTVNIADLGGDDGNGQTFLNYATGQTDRIETIELVYNIAINQEAPEYLANNRTSRRTSFENHMAYDDGTAELTLEGQAGTTILQRYEAYVEDQLLGLQVRIPRGLGGLGDQDLRLVVYTGEEEPTEQVYFEDFTIRYAEEFFRDSLEGYVTYLFDAPLDLATGKFYVGWEQQRANRDIGVGYDRNQPPPAGQGYQWANSGTGWEQLRTGGLTGAIMLRPLLSGFEGFSTGTEDPAVSDALVDVFPNPTNGVLHLRPRPNVTAPLNYRLLAVSGAVLRFGTAGEMLQIGDLPAGVYLLEVSDGTVRSRHKVVRH